MRILFCATGGAGHLLPLRPLAHALRARGHEVAWATAPDALHFVQGRGCGLFAVGPTFQESRSRFRAAFPRGAGLVGEPLSAFTFPRLFGATLAPLMLEDLERVIQQWRPDLVVHEPAALAVPLACRSREVPHLAHGYGLRPPPDGIARAMEWLAPTYRSRGIQTPQDGGIERRRYIDIAPASLQEPDDPGEGFVLTRLNPHRPASEPPVALPARLDDALTAHATARPRIYLTFGTVFNRSAALPLAAQVAARLGGTLVVTVGVDGDLAALSGLGEHAHVLRFVDQQALLPRCDAVISHGGAGAMLGAASHGLPQLVLPQAADHFRNARALSRAGAAIAIEPPEQTRECVLARLHDLLTQPSFAANARRLAEEMAAMPDAEEAVHRVEQWLNAHARELSVRSRSERTTVHR